MLVLMPHQRNGIRQRLGHVIEDHGVRILLFLFGGVLQLHTLAKNVRNLEFPRSVRWNFFLIDHIHPTSHDRFSFARITENHVSDEMLGLDPLLFVKHDNVFLTFFVFFFIVFFLILLALFVFLFIFLAFLVVFLVLVVLLVLLCILVFQHWKPFAKDLIHIFNSVGVPTDINFWKFRFGLLESWSHAPIPHPIGESRGTKYSTERQLAFTESETN
mmetsp:Transcript_54562/g.145696  ORF Transcript_54562/g.145696 Transcript_54562/m.145696 type:complete len:216 (-) Transcript_54562:556-1203(-)